MKLKENIPPAAHSDAEWSRAAWILPWQWIIGIWGRAQCLWGVQVGERSAIMGSALLSPCSVYPASENGEYQWTLQTRMGWKLNDEEVKSEWLKGGSLA